MTLHFTSPFALHITKFTYQKNYECFKNEKISLGVWVNKTCTFSPSLKSVRELLIFIRSGFRQVIFKKLEDFIMISCIFSNGLMEINLQVTVKAFMPSVCCDYKCSPVAQDYFLKWNWKVHTKVWSYKVRPYHTKPCLTSRHTEPATGEVGAIKITALYRIITEEPCACSYPATNAKEITQAFYYSPGDFCIVISQGHLMSTTRVCWWEQFN